MRLSLKILESNKEIAQRVAKALLPEIKNYMKNAIDKIKKDLPSVVYTGIINSPEYTSIIGGQLKYELGIPNPETKIASLLQTWTDNIYVTYVPPTIITSGSIKSSFDVSMIKTDFSDVLSSDDAFVFDQERGYSLPWLKWLLLDGSVPIIKDHQVVIGRNSRSRTGMAVMRQSRTKSWAVPSKFAGTEADNWITRAIDASKSDVESLIKRTLQ